MFPHIPAGVSILEIESQRKAPRRHISFGIYRYYQRGSSPLARGVFSQGFAYLVRNLQSFTPFPQRSARFRISLSSEVCLEFRTVFKIVSTIFSPSFAELRRARANDRYLCLSGSTRHHQRIPIDHNAIR